MNLSDKELKDIERYASIFLKNSDIAVILDIPADKLRDEINDKTTDASAAYRRGKALTLVKIKQQETSLALIGSPLAIENVNKNLLDMEDDE
jgi:hypothetical protein